MLLRKQKGSSKSAKRRIKFHLLLPVMSIALKISLSENYHFFYSCSAENELVKRLEIEFTSVTKLVETLTDTKIEIEGKHKEALENAKNATKPEDKAKYLKTANSLQKDINNYTDQVAVATIQYEQLKRAKTDAEAKLKECLEKNPK